MSEHPSVPVVREGDPVKKGDLVADIPEGKLGARIHSSIDGKVAKIKTDHILIENK